MSEETSLIPIPKEVKTPQAELELMAAFAESEAFNVLRRWARRFGEKLRSQAFLLREDDPKFSIRHAEYKNQAIGQELMIRFVEGAAKKLTEVEEESPNGSV